MKNKNQAEAYKKAVIWGIVAVPILFFAHFITAMIIYFNTGGGIVGGHDDPTPARTPLMLLITIAAVFLNFLVVVGVYKSKLAKQKSSVSKKVPIPTKVYVTGVLIPLVAILLFIGYRWFTENNTWGFNTLTDDCIRLGYKGAKGATCFD